MKPIGEEKEDLELWAAIEALPENSDKQPMLAATFKRLVSQYELGLIDFKEYSSQRAKITAASKEQPV